MRHVYRSVAEPILVFGLLPINYSMALLMLFGVVYTLAVGLVPLVIILAPFCGLIGVGAWLTRKDKKWFSVLLNGLSACKMKQVWHCLQRVRFVV
jgi:hypothetical protein